MDAFLIPKRVHMTGIGGAGMSALAEILLARGHRVSGTDSADSVILRRLSSLGAKVAVGHGTELLEDAELLVWSSAIGPEHLERRSARALGIPDCRRGTLLARLLNLSRGIAIAGAHGKTSTTALLTHVLERCGADPTAVVGGTLATTGSGARVGQSALLLAESDESDGSFLELEPAIACVTNVDKEHLEHWGDEAALHQGFRKFMGSAREVVVVCADDKTAMALAPTDKRVMSYGLNAGAEWRAVELVADGRSTRFSLLHNQREVGVGVLPLPGAHYVQNAAGVVAIAVALGLTADAALQALASFQGVERRFTVLGSVGGVMVVDDYGHHPVEIRATLAAARHVCQGRIHTVFQPHRFTRTRDLMHDFARAFTQTDSLFLLPIYAAGDLPIAGISSEVLAQHIATQRSVQSCATPAEALGALRAIMNAGDLVLLLGAGDVNQLAGPLLAS
jgi:UDP-N-acetylmuramate--alanine ligase